MKAKLKRLTFALLILPILVIDVARWVWRGKSEEDLLLQQLGDWAEDE